MSRPRKYDPLMVNALTAVLITLGVLAGVIIQRGVPT